MITNMKVVFCVLLLGFLCLQALGQDDTDDLTIEEGVSLTRPEEIRGGQSKDKRLQEQLTDLKKDLDGVNRVIDNEYKTLRQIRGGTVKQRAIEFESDVPLLNSIKQVL